MRMTRWPGTRSMACVAVVLATLLGGSARAQSPPVEPAHVELPEGGSGSLLVLLTGIDGAPNHLALARDFARLGWVVHVIDSNRLSADPAARLDALLERSLAQPQVRSAKAALVGYSLGGWLVIAYGNRMPARVAATVAVYPSTSRVGEPQAFLASPPVAVPTLLLAGAKDDFMNCCVIERARALAAAAASPAVRAPVTLVEYPQADHGFVLPAYPQVHRPQDAADALRRADLHLRQHLPR